ncbi:MAG: CAP domain-containing protein [Blastocatellia bacterium]
MRSKLSRIILVTAVLVALLPWTAEGGYSQTGAGVAGGRREARGRTHDSNTGRTHAPEDRGASAEGEATARASSVRIRELESLEERCLAEVNRVRRGGGLARLEFYDDLLPVAREYSRRMAEERFFSHADPEGRTVRERVDEADIRWRMVGENLAYSNGYINPVAASLNGWMDSPGHRRNILDPDFRLTAIGAWISSDGTVYFTEIFLRQ